MRLLPSVLFRPLVRSVSQERKFGDGRYRFYAQMFAKCGFRLPSVGELPVRRGSKTPAALVVVRRAQRRAAGGQLLEVCGKERLVLPTQRKVARCAWERLQRADGIPE
jgi:hypothetical protein